MKLTSREDYESMPVGARVIGQSGIMWEKFNACCWRSGIWVRSNNELAGIDREPISESLGIMREKKEHPAVLETVEDYQNAPDGTIIAQPTGYPWVKDDGLWRSPIFWDSSESLALGWIQPFNVLRWGYVS